MICGIREVLQYRFRGNSSFYVSEHPTDEQEERAKLEGVEILEVTIGMSFNESILGVVVVQ